MKQLIVKNVLMKTQKIRYKLPKTRYFSMEFPKTVTLSAGMSWMIPITFRPLAKVFETIADCRRFIVMLSNSQRVLGNLIFQLKQCFQSMF